MLPANCELLRFISLSFTAALQTKGRFVGVPVYGMGKYFPLYKYSIRHIWYVKETDDGAFNEALGRADLGIVLQSGLGDRTVHKVHAPATLWMATNIKVERKFALVHVFHPKQPITGHSSLFFYQC